MLLLISCGNTLQCRSLYRKMLFKFRLMDHPFPFPAVLRDIIPYHRGRVLKHIRKQPAAQKGLIAGLDHQIVSDRNRQLALRGDMGAERRVIRRFVMAETGIPDKLECQVLRIIL